MDLQTLEWKMKDYAGVFLAENIRLNRKQDKLNPISIYVDFPYKPKNNYWIEFNNYQEVYNCILRDGTKVSKLIDKLTPEDFDKPYFIY